MRRILKGKELIKLIPDDDSPTDGILLFGSYTGKKISEMLGDFKLAPYVLNYLSSSKDLPVKFRKQIKEIVDSFDPFAVSVDVAEDPAVLNVRRIIDPKDDVPW